MLNEKLQEAKKAKKCKQYKEEINVDIKDEPDRKETRKERILREKAEKEQAAYDSCSW